jgi:hypothetical protein
MVISMFHTKGTGTYIFKQEEIRYRLDCLHTKNSTISTISGSPTLHSFLADDYTENLELLAKYSLGVQLLTMRSPTANQPLPLHECDVWASGQEVSHFAELSESYASINSSPGFVH